MSSLRQREAELLKSPSAEGLSFALRNKGVWPGGFTKFDYRYPEICAMALARELWPEHIEDLFHEEVGRALGMGRKDAERIFVRAHERYGKSMREVRAFEVADLLDEWAGVGEKKPSWLGKIGAALFGGK